jgi:mannose-6-phosphate isomerase-like protein (cupin superfamily)
MSATATRQARQAETAGTDMNLAVSLKNEAVYVPGRRDFFRYRDLGVTAATRGRLRAQVTTAIAGMNRPTGWHFHLCEAQFVYVLNGWIDLDLEGRGLVRLAAGDSIMIPGGLPHNEVCISNDFEILEVSVPADMGTEACEAPAP